MKARALTFGLCCLLPALVLIGGAWLLVRDIQAQRRKGWRGRYDQPLEPWVHGDGGRVPGEGRVA